MAVRCGALSLGAHGESFSYLGKGQWQGSLAYRWLHSDRHFIGGREQPQRQAQGSEVINDVHTFDLTATYGVTKRLSLSLTLPFVHANRSSLYEHDRTNRHSMQAGGLSDVRLVGNFWILSPDKYTNGNFSFGVGVKAPTGDYKETDYRFRPTGPVLDYVDNSIQPGDGGWGVLVEALAFQKVFDKTFAYWNATYLINPQNTNSIGNSVWDSYLMRGGLSYALWPSKGLALSLGGRVEGVPPEDAFGESEGRRRPGFAVSIEPGLTWTHKQTSLSLSAPVALYRNRQKNYQDRAGDAAFADFLILSSISYRF
ncbi:MAG: hypothetical protein HY735_16495 [Verrucomicrobia bacterium]|nr:hypothetical protein [Verrucomicrobiota bacterium]